MRSEVYNIEPNNIYLGDCLDLMPQIQDQSVDMVLCDLPYGTTSCKWDVIIPFDRLWEQYKRICKPNAAILLFGQEPFSSYIRLSNVKDYKYDIYWQKERLTNIQQVKRRVGKDVETISVFYKKQCTYNPQMQEYYGKRRSNKIGNGKLGLLTDSGNKVPKEYVDTGKRYPTQVWKFKRDILTSNLHPTQKPIALLEELIKTFSNKQDVVLDNCMGSGSTIIAAIREGRQYMGIEKEEKYFDIANKRIAAETSQLTLF